MVPSKIRPMFNHIVVTMEKEAEDKKIGKIIDVTKREGMVKDIQTVVAVGSTVTSVKPGDVVHINPNRYIRTKQSLKDDLDSGTNLEVNVKFPVVELAGVDYLFLFDSDVDYIVEEWAPNPSAEIYQVEKLVN